MPSFKTLNLFVLSYTIKVRMNLGLVLFIITIELKHGWLATYRFLPISVCPIVRRIASICISFLRAKLASSSKSEFCGSLFPYSFFRSARLHKCNTRFLPCTLYRCTDLVIDPFPPSISRKSQTFLSGSRLETKFIGQIYVFHQFIGLYNVSYAS